MDTLLDGVLTGMIGALSVVLWFLGLDIASGRPFHTPAMLGWVLLHGGAAIPAQIAIDPLPIAAYTAFHFVMFIAAGITLAYLMNLFDRFPIVFFVLLVLALCLQIGVFALDAILGTKLIGRLQPWAVIVANLLAAGSMVLYQWRRHPGAMRNIDSLWRDDGTDSSRR